MFFNSDGSYEDNISVEAEDVAFRVYVAARADWVAYRSNSSTSFDTLATLTQAKDAAWTEYRRIQDLLYPGRS